MSTQTARLPVARPLLLIAGLLLIACTLRAPVTGVAPVLDMIQSAYGLTRAQAGLLTTLPLVAFGVISPFAASIARAYGLERTLFGALVLVIAGMAIRSVAPLWGLFAGTCVIGSGIAIANVLLPSLVKRDFPHKVPTVTGLSALMMGAIAAGASATAVPLAEAYGWRAALGALAVLPLAAIVAWSAQLGAHTAPARSTAAMPHGGRVWHSPIAWQVTLYMGINSLLYYVLVGWLPAILIDHGYTAAQAGSLHGLMQLACALPGLVLGSIVSRMKNQAAISAAMGVAIGVSLVGFLYAPGLATVWAVLFGAGSGSAIILSLMFMSLRVANAHQAAALSGMAQGVGYLLAACGPILAGMAHDVAGNWHTVMAGGIVLSAVMAVFGALAGRARQMAAHGGPSR
ncbi:MFS transporter [Bordetella bronchialis]|uniref:MFS transporter n=1 Tax=Bordetella bronchialis TaxID=463025 RepID=A0A193FZ16_9BORD|nr:MFS transporter [Bordetella bronchialis]ANN67539.1 MFS transporter [Bordetella bronchialis]ANN72628.1 MFS transporter [Bordetella bronchialis]